MDSKIGPRPAGDAGAMPGRPAFRLHEAGAHAAPVLFASPHSGSHYPASLLSQLRVPIEDLRRTEDAFVDELFARAPDLGGSLIVAQYARAYVDLNRDSRELDPSMFADGVPRPAAVPSARVRAGLGCLPRVAAGGQPIYAAKLSRAEGETRLVDVYDTYHSALKKELDQYVKIHGLALLIDCHSMPSIQPGRSKLSDIVLGDRFGSSCDQALTSLVERCFRDLGYSVSRNTPYAGGYTTRRYGRPRRQVHALQIEINRGLYMNERRVEKSGGFAKLRADISDIIEHVVSRGRRLAA